MKILPLSDLHLEWGSETPEFVFIEEDKTDTVVTLAGDIHNNDKAIDWIENHLVGKVKAIIYVPGNHEYYGHNFMDVDESIRKEIVSRGLEEDIFFLNGQTAIIGDVKFIGATLWTNINNRNNDDMTTAKFHMNDYNLIKNGVISGTYNNYVPKLQPEATIVRHEEQVAFILKELRKEDDLLHVVVTHHLPSHSCIRPWFRRPNLDHITLALNHSYASNLDYILHNEEVHVWFHGHSHAAYSEMVENTLVVSNALGYPGSYVRDFDPNRRVEVV